MKESEISNLAYEMDASMIKGRAKKVLSPMTIKEVKDIVSSNPRICIRGGGSGLAGGAVPEQGVDVLIDMSKLNKIGDFDSQRKTIEVEAGVVLDDLQDHLATLGLEFPVNPSSHSICTIGGMIATDAVGSRAMKYGKTSGHVRWIEVIDGDGKMSKRGATEISDYAGMEGITGVIVRACLNLEKLKVRTASLLSVDEISKIIPIVHNLKRDIDISAIEYLDRKVSRGIGLEDKYHLIVEYENNNGTLKGEEYEKIMELRNKIYPFVASEGYTHIEDPKLMLDRMPELLEWLDSKKIPVFGHISVGILHPCFYQGQKELIPELMKYVRRVGGQVSGEHGIGLVKKRYVEMNDKKIIENVKKRTDPKNKFNVGKVI
jgi:glycolate oxidase